MLKFGGWELKEDGVILKIFGYLGNGKLEFEVKIFTVILWLDQFCFDYMYFDPNKHIISLIQTVILSLQMLLFSVLYG